VNPITCGALNIFEDALGSLPMQIMGLLHAHLAICFSLDPIDPFAYENFPG